MSTLNRRSFSKTLSFASLAFVGFKLTGCGPTNEVEAGVSGVETVNVTETVTMYDMQMEGWSTLSGVYLGNSGVLKATVVEADQDVTLKYTQDGDGHVFTLTKTDLRRLRKGQSVSVLTTVANNHHHEVRVDPKKNRIVTSTPIEMPVDPDATVPPPPPSEELFAKVDERDDPSLYVAGSAELDPESVDYCMAPADQCKNDQSLWHRMKTYASTGRSDQMFVSGQPLGLDASKAEQAFSLRAKLKSDGSVVTTFLKLLKL